MDSTASIDSTDPAAQAAERPGPVILTELTGDGVLLLTLNRPERHNAWTLEMELLYNELFDRAERDPAVRVVVLTGAGRSFCPGMDMSVLDGASSGARPWPTDRLPPRSRPLFLPKPVVAAVNGACAGIGFNQALMCDVRFAVPHAKFAAAFSARGLVAEDGVSWLLPRLVGYGNASDLLLSSRRLTGTEALAMGLVNRLAEPEDLLPAALAYATELARSASPYAMSLIKRQLADDQAKTFTGSRDDAIALLATAKRAPDYREGVLSFIERRQPRFAPLGETAQVPGKATS
ncbi:enoyl-CoA hydratase-related protein [Streptomyces sp. NPDC005574]|uniref:enoyl-CoA hydratase-related protein n=1 Tax=Streptomyces sp. NPDC005574 TaxID=3156891 RepID=UPI0033BFA8F0